MNSLDAGPSMDSQAFYSQQQNLSSFMKSSNQGASGGMVNRAANHSHLLPGQG